ncbi:hypothetical protein ES703_18843 [subsurface metagenome]
MGTPVPPGWPDIEDDKWYRVTENAYFGVEFEPGCVGGVFSKDWCCRKGNVINEYFAAGDECHWFVFLCPGGSPRPKRVIDIRGPYDTQDACIAAG